MARVQAARHWAFLSPGRLATVRGEVERLTAAGVGGVLVPQIFGPPWATLGAAAACGELELASGIAMAFVRSPLETAMAALDLDRLSSGRFTLGLGSSVRAWNEDRFGVDYDRPVARLRELVGLVRRMVTLDEQPTIGRFEGEFWNVDLTGIRLPRPVRPSLPITVAPLRSAMIEMAAEVADGILGHPVWSPAWITGGAREAIDRGLGPVRSRSRRVARHGLAAGGDHRRRRRGPPARQGGHPVLRRRCASTTRTSPGSGWPTTPGSSRTSPRRVPRRPTWPPPCPTRWPTSWS